MRKAKYDIFKDKICLITGGTSGIGKELARQLNRLNSKIIIVGRDENQVKNCISEFQNEGYVIEGFKLDVTNYTQYKSLTESIFDKHGKIDYLFNNAGITDLLEFQNYPIEKIHEILNVNLLGVINGTNLIYQHMKARRAGHIINIGSLAGLFPLPTCSPYAASKFALMGFSNCLSIEAKKYDVIFTCVCLGFVDTPLFTRSQNQIASLRNIKPMTVTQSANLIIKAVIKEKNVEVIPAKGSFFWKLYTCFPNLYIKYMGRAYERDTS